MKLNRQLVAAGSAAAVLGLARARLQELNAVNVTTVLNQVAKRPDGRKEWDADPTLASELLAAARRFAQNGLPRELASTAWSVAALQLRDAPLLEAISSRSLAQHFKPQGLSNLSWAFATLQ